MGGEMRVDNIIVDLGGLSDILADFCGMHSA